MARAKPQRTPLTADERQMDCRLATEDCRLRRSRLSGMALTVGESSLLISKCIHGLDPRFCSLCEQKGSKLPGRFSKGKPTPRSLSPTRRKPWSTAFQGPESVLTIKVDLKNRAEGDRPAWRFHDTAKGTWCLSEPREYLPDSRFGQRISVSVQCLIMPNWRMKQRRVPEEL